MDIGSQSPPMSILCLVNLYSRTVAYTLNRVQANVLRSGVESHPTFAQNQEILQSVLTSFVCTSSNQKGLAILKQAVK